MLKRIRLLLPTTALLLCACATQPPVAEGISSAPDPVEQTLSRPGAGATLLASAQPLSGILSDTPAALASTDLWESMRRDFGLPANNNERVRTQRNWYARHPEYMRRVSQRASRYAAYILQQVQQRNLPAEIALLPIVESAYDPFAYSHGRAAGLWQFIPATGKRFKLKQDWWYDGRRDLIESTRAALDYLEYLNKRFDGDWMLALAAYNSGEGTVGKAIRRNRKKGKPISFWDLNLPRETRDYVPKLVALKQLVNSPEKYNVSLEPVDIQPAFDVIDTGGQIDLAIAADLAGIDLDALYRFNPGFNQWATPPKGPHRLLIPNSQAEQFREAIAGLPPKKRIQWVRHKVVSGQTLGHIARRYHTTVDALKAANQIRGHSIRAGNHLLVPVSSKGQENYRLSAKQRLNRKQNTDRKGQRSQHIVTRGDTFWDLSRQYKISMRKLASWNGMAPGDPLRVGQKLVLWTKQPSRNSAHPGTRQQAIHYTVRKGDSLSRISSRFKVRVSDLRRWNGLSKKGYLQPGQHLKLYIDVTRQTGT
ncbi:membrane-bound lytic murein transglycosylase D [Thiogranum longum]|uniref:Membrane-bound lytic murein transglycosylase D n=1 Tax=Thiogranum longum TaxID=1537524 RepID=A0A4R1HBQ6_9GAMM|nr:LysM peptidoglycan-binding domain-containing protein [Thiogranum longum]TCK17963.1 membrane-bound lytic murein transglycosylase D [Thiogranum longum]